MFSFTIFYNWLDRQAVCWRTAGYSVDLHRVDLPERSCLLRIESPKYLGEIIVWSSGLCDEVIGQLNNGEFVYERYGFQLDDGPGFSLAQFLSYFPTEQGGVVTCIVAQNLRNRVHALIDTISDDRLLQRLHDLLSEQQQPGIWKDLTEEQRERVLKAYESSFDPSRLQTTVEVMKRRSK